MKKRVMSALLAAGCILLSGCGEKLPERVGGQNDGNTAQNSQSVDGVQSSKGGLEFLCDTESVKDGYKKFDIDLAKLDSGKGDVSLNVADYNPKTNTIIATVMNSNGYVTCEEISLGSYQRTMIFEYAENVKYTNITRITDDVIVYTEGFDENYSNEQTKSVVYNRNTGEKTVLVPFGTQENDGEFDGALSFCAINGGKIYYDNYVYDDIAESISFNIEVFDINSKKHETFAPNAVLPFEYRDTIAYMSYTNGKIETDALYAADENIMLLNQQMANHISCDDGSFTYCYYDYTTGAGTASCIKDGKVIEVLKTKSKDVYISDFVSSGGKASANVTTEHKPFYYDLEKNKVITLENESSDYYIYVPYKDGLIISKMINQETQSIIVV